MIPPNGIPCKKCGKTLCIGFQPMPDICPHCGQVYRMPAEKPARFTADQFCKVYAKIEHACDEYLKAKRRYYSGGLAIRSIEETSIMVQYTSTCYGCSDNEYENVGFSDLGMSLRQMINETE